MRDDRRRQHGHRGSQRPSECMMAMRKVTIESAKWRSGRVLDLVVSTRRSGLGGKSSCALGDEEGVAGEDTADVGLPAGVGAPLEVVEAQLALEIFVDSLGAPTLLDPSHELLARHRLGQGGQDVVLDRASALVLVNNEPLLFAARVVVGDRSYSKRRETGAQRAFAALSPRHLPVAVLADDLRDGLDAHRIGVAPVVAHDPHARVLLHVQRVVEAERTYAGAEITDVAIAAVGEHHPDRDARLYVAPNQVERNLPLRPIAG